VRNLYRKIIGPFLDRIGVEIETFEQNRQLLQASNDEKNSAWWYSQVMEGVSRMRQRQGNKKNTHLGLPELYPLLNENTHWQKLVQKYSETLGLSHRGVINTLRLAVSIKDFQAASRITDDILEEAFSFRVICHFQKNLLDLAA
jgi:predicted ATPase with chaperone activity